jgi:hypothetical protein
MFAPIVRAEQAFQRRTLRGAGWLNSPLMFGLLIVGASAAGLMLPHADTWAARAGVTPFDALSTLSAIHSVLTTLTILNLFADYWRVISGAARGASVALTREYQARTWESLILTGVSARHLVISKWWGVLRAIWEVEHRMLLIRAIVFFWLLSPLAHVEWNAFRALSAGVLSAVLLVALLTPPLMSAFAAALGILVSSMARRDAISVRVGAGALLMVNLLALLIGLLIDAAARWSLFTAPSALLPLEGGIFTVLSLGLSFGIFYNDPVSVPVDQLLITAALFAALTAAALYAAILIVRRQGGLAHSQRASFIAQHQRDFFAGGGARAEDRRQPGDHERRQQ